jgi:hypothetical protein
MIVAAYLHEVEAPLHVLAKDRHGQRHLSTSAMDDHSLEEAL